MKEQRERRTYGQQCGLAYALDIVGERWTLLIVREMLLRPRRYRELLDALPGIGTNLLAERLNFLTQAGVIEPTDPDRRTGGYALTELGEKLREPVLAMARFGLAVMSGQSEPSPGTVTRASWAVLAIEAMCQAERATADETYEFDVAGEVFHVIAGEGKVTTSSGPAVDPVLRISTDTQTFFDLGSGLIEPVEAVLSGSVAIEGPPAAVPRCLYLLGLGSEPAERSLLGPARRTARRPAAGPDPALSSAR
ncbi:winged helix-turn-helix transcriptional regulator [Polymorphospora rubra]|uniref:HxlR family transcriptional regulator n=1 Tax=Polymorphospora rubra TaxID=338584 RepID=A0A810N4L3_9ACTN|nr:helix-turn-helix domain-containing protein [Polymorphospora rubra]BCJ66678.1 HxlR family transcriptional regulator [Polymorphospora rubra]